MLVIFTPTPLCMLVRVLYSLMGRYTDQKDLIDFNDSYINRSVSPCVVTKDMTVIETHHD